MQVVIEIPEEQYELLCKQKDRPCRLLIEKAITDGIILPKDHNDLIDVREAYDSIAEQEGGNYVDMDLVGKGLECTTVIVPADKEDADDK